MGTEKETKRAAEEGAEGWKKAAEERAREKVEETAQQETERKAAEETNKKAAEEGTNIQAAEEDRVQRKSAEEKAKTTSAAEDVATSAEEENARKKEKQNDKEADDLMSNIYARNTSELIEERREKLKTEGGRVCRCSRCIREEEEHAQASKTDAKLEKHNASMHKKNLQAENVMRHSGLVPASTVSEIVDGSVVRFDAGAPHGRLRMLQTGKVDMMGGHGTWTNFVIHLRPSLAQSDGVQIVLQSKPQQKRYLSFSVEEGLTYKTFDNAGSALVEDECAFQLSATECGQDGYIFELRPATVDNINLHPGGKGFKVYLKKA